MIRFLTIAALALLTLANCGTTPTSGSTAGQTAPVVDGQTNQITTGAMADYQPVERQSASSSQPGSYADISSQVFSDNTSPLSTRSIFFDFDNYTVSENYLPAIEAHAKFLMDNPNAKMMIQGNTDSRGTREYNLVLGQKRSDAVRDMLIMMGAKEDQIESVSLGEENLQALGNSDSDHAQNRRADLLYRYQDRQEF